MESLTKQQVIDGLWQFSVDDLHEMNGALVEVIKSKRTAQSKAMIRQLKVGTRVAFKGEAQRGLYPGCEGKITRVGRTKVSVKFDDQPVGWDMHPTLLEVLA